MAIDISSIKFHSDDHIRYENGHIVVTASSDSQGHNKGANRGIQVEPNINGGDGYTVTIFNLDGNHPLWGNNVQMAPKQMKIISTDNTKIVLRGYGYDAMGGSFADYGLTIYNDGNEPTKLIMHMHDRNIDIEYFKSINKKFAFSDIEVLSRKIYNDISNNNAKKSDLVELYSKIVENPQDLKNVKNKADTGRCLLVMMDQGLTDDIDILQRISSISYLCISDAINNQPNDLNLLKDRFLLLEIAHDPFKYSVFLGLDIDTDPFSIMGANMAGYIGRDAIYKMQISDLERTPFLYQQVDYFVQKKKEFDDMIAQSFFLPEKTRENVIKSGIENHEKMYEYLKQRILVDGDIDF